jgi:3-hydroxyisobutyrate dehydrogenase
MGGRIARRIADRGHSIVGFDASADRLRETSLPVAGSLAELVSRVDVILFSLPNSRIIEEVVYGDEGVLASCRPGQVVVDLSTAAPSSTVAIHEALGKKGVELVDAGISGGAAAAEQGTLSIMAGGSAEALERVTPLLECFATRVYHMGASGSGHVAKVLNNFLNGVSLAATAEVMVAAKQAGLDLAQFLDVVNHSSGVNFATTNRFPRIIEGDYLEGGLTSDLMAKDIQLYLDLARRLGVTSLSGPSCLGAFHLASALGYGDQISNRVVDAIGDIAGGVRLHDERSEE